MSNRGKKDSGDAKDAFGDSGDVTKSVLIVPPRYNSAAEVASLRVALINSGFVVVRQENRTISTDVARKLLASQNAAQPLAADLVGAGAAAAAKAGFLVGDAHIFVVAAAEATPKLVQFGADFNRENFHKEQAHDDSSDDEETDGGATSKPPAAAVGTYYPNMLFLPQTAEEAARRILLLFPRMVPEPIPSNAAIRDYCEREMKSTLVRALTECAKKKPENAVEFVAKYLIENNPRNPPVSSSSAA